MAATSHSRTWLVIAPVRLSLDEPTELVQWNIFDYMNVNNIHNSTFHQNIPAGYMNQARDLANWHEYNVFSDPSISGIGNSERPSISCPKESG
jgi:hypothetical protein